MSEWQTGIDDHGEYWTHTDIPYKYRSAPHTSMYNRKDRRKLGMRMPILAVREHQKFLEEIKSEEPAVEGS